MYHNEKGFDRWYTIMKISCKTQWGSNAVIYFSDTLPSKSSILHVNR